MSPTVRHPNYPGMIVAIGRGDLHADAEDIALRLVARMMGWPEDDEGMARLNQLCIDAVNDPALQAQLEAASAEWRVENEVEL